MVLPERRPLWLPALVPEGCWRYRIYAEVSLIGVRDFRTFVMERDCTPAQMSAMLQGWHFTVHPAPNKVVHVRVYDRTDGQASLPGLRETLALPSPSE